MTTTTFHANVQRSRFVQLTLSALATLVPPLYRGRPPAAQREPRRGAAEAASLDAQQVRELASSYSNTDPGFASELYAAAARHEGLYAD